MNNPKPLKQIAKENIRLDDEQLDKDLAKLKISPHYFTDRKPKIAFKFTLDCRHINHAISELTTTA